MKSKLFWVWVCFLAILVVIALPGSHPVEAAGQPEFDRSSTWLACCLRGRWPAWRTSHLGCHDLECGDGSGTDLVITDVFSDVLRIDRVQTLQGQAAVSQQTVVYTLSVLNPGETAQVSVVTTVLRSPANAVLINQACWRPPVLRDRCRRLPPPKSSWLPACLPRGIPPVKNCRRWRAVRAGGGPGRFCPVL